MYSLRRIQLKENTLKWNTFEGNTLEERIRLLEEVGIVIVEFFKSSREDYDK
jgi:hypothetical protein